MAVNIFGIALSTASKIIHEVCKTVTEHYGLKYIHFPRTEEEMIPKASEFEIKYGMVQAFGCIDGTMFQFYALLRIPRTSMFLSLTVQAFWITGVFLWMWTADGLVLSTKPKCFEIQE